MIHLVDESIEEYASSHTSTEPALLLDLIEKTHTGMKLPQMLTGRVEGRLLRLLVQLLQPKLIVEIGTFTGYSALSMAEGMPEGGKIITCDIDPEAQRYAQAAFDAYPYGSMIELRMGPAIDTIRRIDEPIDFSFIDADKEGYPEYYEELLPRTRAGGLILLDNALMSGRVLNPNDDASRAVARLNDRIAQDERVEHVFLPVRDGVLIVRKKS